MNQESLNDTQNLNNNVAQPVQPTYTTPVEPVQPAYTTPVEPVQQAYTAPVEPVQPAYTAPAVPAEPVQPAYTAPAVPTEPVQPTYTAPAVPAEPVQPTYTAPVEPVQSENAEAIDKVSNLNKEDAMEEALSHTNQYTPFEAQQEEVNQEVNLMSNKKALIFLGVILGVMLLFIIFLPQISKIIGW